MITLVDRDRAEGVWLRLGQDMGANWRGCARYLAKLALHGLFAGAVVVLALAADGTEMSWALLYAPLLSVLGITLAWLVTDLVRKAPNLEERALFTRSFVVFVLLIAVTSATMAALVGKGIRVVERDSTLSGIPSLDLATGTLQRKWGASAGASAAGGDGGAGAGTGDATAFVQLAEGDPFASADLDRWIGLNISSADIRPVYDSAAVNGRCFAERPDGSVRLCALDEAPHASLNRNGSATARFCSIANIMEAPFEQTCRSVADAECQLYVRPMSFFDRTSDRNVARRLEVGIARSGEGELCANTCKYHGDTECDDGGPMSMFSVCSFGTDCQDCGTRSWHMEGFTDSIYFPQCGYFASEDTSEIEGGFPQRYVAPWASGQRAVCQQQCDADQIAVLNAQCDLASDTRCTGVLDDEEEIFAFATYAGAGAGNLSWCCDETAARRGEAGQAGQGRPSVEAIHVPTRRTVALKDCVRACLVQYYYDQAACSLIQFEASSGRCERVDPRGERLCAYTSSEGLDCRASLQFEGGVKNGGMYPLAAPASADVTLRSSAVTDAWDRVRVSPAANTWAAAQDDWTLYVMLEQGFVGVTPSSITMNTDMQVVLAPFLCIPLVLSLLAICVCCTPINCLPDVRITDEDACAWDYVCFKGPAYVNAQLHNFRLLVLTIGITASAMYLFFRKIVFGRADPTAPSWAVVFVPVWVVSALILASFVSLLVSARLVLSNTCGSCGQRARLGLHSNSYLASSPRGRFILVSFWTCLVLLVPVVIALILLAFRLEQLDRISGASNGSIDFVLKLDAVSTTVPIFLGFMLNAMGFAVYVCTAIYIRSHQWKMTRLEALELGVRAKLRLDRAKQIAHLKDRFLEKDRNSEELIEIMQLFVFRGRECAVSHEEVRDLGHAKLALLEASGEDVTEIWTPEVAREFGELLRFLLSAASEWPLPGCTEDDLGPARLAAAAAASKRVLLRDLGYSMLAGWADLVFRPAEIQRCMLAHLSREDELLAAGSGSKGFDKFLSTKRRVANAFSARFDANEQPVDPELSGDDAAGSSPYDSDSRRSPPSRLCAEEDQVQLAVL